MRWIDPDAKEWKLVFDEGVGKEQVVIEKGERGIYRVSYWRGDTKATIHLHGETPEKLAESLINEGMFTELKAHSVAEKIDTKPANGSREQARPSNI